MRNFALKKIKKCNPHGDTFVHEKAKTSELYKPT